MKRFLYSAVAVLSLFFLSFQPHPNKAADLLNDMLTSIEEIDQLYYVMKSWERVESGEEKNYTKIKTKLQEEPTRKMYIKKFTNPNKGAEILWVEGKWGGDAYVYTNGFPYFNVELSPYSRRMRKKQHHTILNSGFGLLSEIVTDAIERAKQRDAIDEVFHYKGKVTHNSRPCHKIVVHDPTFHFESYTVKEGEDLDDIADERNICAYLIKEKNDNVDYYNDVSKGQTIQIPSSYAKKSVLFIDRKNMLPIGQHLYDEKGMFERYEFHDVDTNPSFSDKEFTDEYEEYGF